MQYGVFDCVDAEAIATPLGVYVLPIKKVDVILHDEFGCQTACDVGRGPRVVAPNDLDLAAADHPVVLREPRVHRRVDDRSGRGRRARV